mmetsp:Transcript_5/g.9  ORF Transcript_5/g.9 Transcript_5/m.9 type:complete len:269 (-) Transcript_5:87-893(-)
MSGIDLRNAAMNGEADVLKRYLIRQCNPCSCDEHDLTPLHYAVWNGHVECVKLLSCNTQGVNRNGQRCKSMEMISCMGYTALHLAALDCPRESVYEITIILLVAGAALSVRCNEQKTAYTIALEFNNEGFLKAYDEFSRLRQDEELLNRFKSMRDDLNEKYCHQINTKVRGTVEQFETKFTLPEFLFEDTTRSGNIPPELKIHEHQIKPLAMTAFESMEGKDAIWCLTFSTDQAVVNKQRRERLLEISDPNLPRDEIKPILEQRGKRG